MVAGLGGRPTRRDRLGMGFGAMTRTWEVVGRGARVEWVDWVGVSMRARGRVGARRTLGVDRHVAGRGDGLGRRGVARAGWARLSSVAVTAVGRVEARVVRPRSRSGSSTSSRSAVVPRRRLDLPGLMVLVGGGHVRRRLRLILLHARRATLPHAGLRVHARRATPHARMRGAGSGSLHARRGESRSPRRLSARGQLGELADRCSDRRITLVAEHRPNVERSGVRPRVPLIDRLTAHLAKGRARGDTRSAAWALADARRRPGELGTKFVVAYVAPHRVRRVVGATGRAWDRFGHRVRHRSSGGFGPDPERRPGPPYPALRASSVGLERPRGLR